MSSAYTLGISQGSGLSMLLIVILLPGLYDWLPLLSMAGGIAAFSLIWMLAWRNGTTPARLVLSGVIIGTISIALQKGLYYFVQDIGVFQDVLSWTTGSLIGLSWQHLRMIFPWTCLVTLACLLLHKPLDVMLLGDSNAKALRRLGREVEAAIRAGRDPRGVVGGLRRRLDRLRRLDRAAHLQAARRLRPQEAVHSLHIRPERRFSRSPTQSPGLSCRLGRCRSGSFSTRSAVCSSSF